MTIARFAGLLGAVATFALAAAGSARAPVGDRPVVRAPAGAVAGTADGAIRAFKGIPYAVPPVGGLRWRAPLPMPHQVLERPLGWAGVFRLFGLVRLRRG